MNSPLAVLPARVASPRRFSTFLRFSKLLHLLFQRLIDFLRTRHLERPLQSFALYRLFRPFLRPVASISIVSSAVFKTRIISFLLFISPHPMHCLSGTFFAPTVYHFHFCQIPVLLLSFCQICSFRPKSASPHIICQDYSCSAAGSSVPSAASFSAASAASSSATLISGSSV